ncbi:MAG: ATP-dependent DNA ligase [Candidatus Acidiferrales bacterium]
MLRFAQTCDAIAATAKKLEKVALVADYLRSLDEDSAALAAIYLCGVPFPRYQERTLNVGGRSLWEAVQELTGADESAMSAAYRRYGDAGSAVGELLAARKSAGHTLADLARTFKALSRARTREQKLGLLLQLFSALSGPEAKYATKIITGDMRIGLKESLLEEGVARAWARPLAAVHRANMLTGDIGAVARLAARDRLGEAVMRLFTPLASMLASPVETAEEAMEYFPEGALVEDKYDGIRAQAHKQGTTVRLYSRTLDEITEFPEVNAALAAFPGDFIHDGEIIGWDTVAARPLPFTTLQQRLGRKQLGLWTAKLLPVRFLAFDLLYVAQASSLCAQLNSAAAPPTGTTDLPGGLLLDVPLFDRRRLLERLLSAPRSRAVPPASRRPVEAHQSVGRPALADESQCAGLLTPEPTPARTDTPLNDLSSAPSASSAVILAPAAHCNTADQLPALFEAAFDHGNEGIVAKDPVSYYTPGRRGKAWLKLKRPLATLDVVVVAVEFGHGRRHHVLSDYTFAVRDGGRLAVIGKAYSGLTDSEIADLTAWFQQHTLQDEGFRRTVQPQIVIEVAFNNIQRSARHPSGFALRFPRILLLRPDKPVAEIDTLDRVRQLFALQSAQPQINADKRR